MHLGWAALGGGRREGSGNAAPGVDGCDGWMNLDGKLVAIGKYK